MQENGSHLDFNKFIIDLEIKFKKLDIFFKEILPLRGWDAYQAVNVQYKDQIVCD